MHQRLHAGQSTWLGAEVTSLPGWFVEHQLDDGGWNCEWVQGATRSSFHSTINAPNGLLAHESATGDGSVRQARKQGEEYLLSRRLIYRASDGDVVGPWATMFSSPIRWHYSALKALDYLRRASTHDRVAPDPRLAEAIDLVRAARRADGTWVNQHVFGRCGVVPHRCPRGAGVQVAHPVRHPGAALVGRGSVSHPRGVALGA
ncbi:MAG: hypothetical protein WCF36_09000 [Candidatus Nanopelagicales bacterium]